MYTKPCARADRGCDGLAKAHSIAKLVTRKFCSIRCGCVDRVERGEGPQFLMTTEQLAAAGRKGGKQTGARHRRAVMLKAIGGIDVEAQIAIERSGSRLRPADFTAIEYLLANVYFEGWKRGYQAGWRKDRTASEQAQKGAAA